MKATELRLRLLLAILLAATFCMTGVFASSGTESSETASFNAPKTGGASAGIRNAHPNAHGFSARNVNAVAGNKNCASCAIAFDSTLAGSPASALRSGITSTTALEAQFGSTFTRGLTSTNVGYRIGVGGNGARGIVFGSRGPGKVGHFFNVVNQKGTVRFIDQQTGTAAKLSGFSEFWLLKTN